MGRKLRRCGLLVAELAGLGEDVVRSFMQVTEVGSQAVNPENHSSS